MRLAILSSHPIQYYSPLFRELGRRVSLHVFFAHRATAEDQARAGYGTAFDWDVDLTSGYEHSFLKNVSKHPTTETFAGCDTPEIGQLLDAGGFDALLVDGWRLKAHLQALFAANKRRIPVMVRGDSTLQRRRPALTRFSKRLLYPPFLRRFAAALYVGKQSRAYYEHYRYPSDRLFHSPHCVDTKFFRARATSNAREELRKRLGVAPDVALLLFAGRLLPLKRPQDVVAAAAELINRGRPSAIIVAGSGPLEQRLRILANDSGVPLHILGFLNQTEMPAAYAAADVLVLPSEQETWGLVCNEAIASGTPIVVSDQVGCAPDLARQSLVGRTYPCGNPLLMASSITEVLEQPRFSSTFESASRRISVEAAADGVEEALRALCTRGNRRSPIQPRGPA